MKDRGFGKDQYREFTFDMAASLAQLASLVRSEGTEDEYMSCMDFGAGATAALNVVGDMLESGSVPSGTSMLLDLAGTFDESQAKRGFLKALYKAKNGKED